LDIDVESGAAAEKECELLVIGGFEDSGLEGVAKSVDGALGGELSDMIRDGEFKGKPKQVKIVRTQGRIRPKRVLLVGLGRSEGFDTEVVRSASGKAGLTVREAGLTSYTTTLLEAERRLPMGRVVEGIVEGCELALYRFSKYKSPEPGEGREVEKLTILLDDPEYVYEAREAVARTQIIDRGVMLARDLSNTPSSDCTPTYMAERAVEVARESGLKCKVLGVEEMKRLGMGGILGVSRGSQQPPRLVILEYRGGGDSKPIVLVGKGVTFDSGGISIKPSEKMEEMKYDKSGAAAVIAVLQVAAQLRLPLNIVGITPIVENLPSGSAYKPGDILRMYGGKSVEVISTDAEGRLILADALAYASSYSPQAVIDIATLTGAVVIALGNLASGLLGNNEELNRRIKEAGEVTGERVWELPLWSEYQEQLKSEVADIKNVGGRPAGTITGASFLSSFVDYPWAHLDIAGTAYTQNGMPERPYIPKGATGVGVRLLTEVLRGWRAA